MKRFLATVWLLGLFAFAAGAVRAAGDPGVPPGCVVDCPTCNPGQPCPLRPCRLICPEDTTPCGLTVCTRGQVCCNASCGICTPLDGVCTQQVCEPSSRCGVREACEAGFLWSEERCACVPEDEGGACRESSDCELLADYCTGCDCRALGVDDEVPACGLPGVRCFADPCLNQRAVCAGGRCVVRRACVPNVPCLRGYRWSEDRCACIKDRPARQHRKHLPAAPRSPHGPKPPRIPAAPRS